MMEGQSKMMLDILPFLHFSDAIQEVREARQDLSLFKLEATSK